MKEKKDQRSKRSRRSKRAKSINPNISQRLHLYKEKLADILSSSDNIDQRVIDSTRSLISRMRDEIILKTVDAQKRSSSGVEPSWGPYWAEKLRVSYNDVIDQIGEQFAQDLSQYSIEAVGVGAKIAEDGLKFAAPSIEISSDSMDPETIKIASLFSADLITKMKKNQIEDISKELALSISLREDASQFINRLAVDIDKGPWKSAKFRAEVIGRTEVSRVQELARKQRANQLQREFPDIKMYQQWLAVPTSQQPCRTCFRYDGNVYDLEGNPILIGKDKAPGKRPDIPVHPNCRCTLIPYVPGMSQEPEDSSSPEDVSEYPEIGEQVLVHWSDQLESWIVRFHPSRQINSQSIRIPKSAPDESLNEEVVRLAKFWQIPHWNLNIMISRPQSMNKPIPIEGKSHIQILFEKDSQPLQEAAAPGTRWYGVPKSYHTWRGIKDRCLNKNNKDYPRYGGRGVKMDPGWQASYAIFLRDMGEPPEEGYSLDRIDNNGNYEKKNCKWVSKKEQAQNRSTSLKNRLPRIEVDKDPSTSTSKKFVKKSMPKIVPILADLHPSSQSQYKKK